jgi:hypothetical protein
MVLYTIYIQLRSRLHKYYKIRISCEKITSKSFPQRYDKNDKFKRYGIRTVKIRSSKLVFADGGAGFSLYYSALEGVLHFLFPNMYSGLNEYTRCHHSLIFVLLSSLLFVQESK